MKPGDAQCADAALKSGAGLQISSREIHPLRFRRKEGDPPAPLPTEGGGGR
jgi:hypothetical protein